MKQQLKFDDFLKKSYRMPVHKSIMQDSPDEAISFIENAPILSISDSNNVIVDGYIRMLLGEAEVLVFHPSNQNLEYGIFLINKQWKSALHLAAEKGMVDVIKALVKKSKSQKLANFINWIDGYGRTALHYAAMGSHEAAVRCLTSLGADVNVSDVSRKARAVDMLPSKPGGYSQNFLALFFTPDPFDSAFSAKESNSLHKLIEKELKDDSEGIFIQIKDCIFSEDRCLVKNPNGKLPSEIAKLRGKQKISDFLSMYEAIFSLTSNYFLIFYSIELDKNKKRQFNRFDSEFLKLLSKGLILIKEIWKHQKKGLPIKFDFFIKPFELVSTITYMISFDLQRQCSDDIPWQQLVSLAHVVNNSNLEGFFERHMDPFIIECLPNLITNLTRVPSYQNQSSSCLGEEKEDQEEDSLKLIHGMNALYEITRPVIDKHTLEKMVKIGDQAQQCNIHTKNGRRAVLYLVKCLGELSKYTSQFPNLHPAVKILFSDDVNWKELGQLRDYIAKALKRPKNRKSYQQIIENTDIQKELFEHLQQDLCQLSQMAKRALETVDSLLTPENNHEIENFYKKGFLGFIFSSQLKQELEQDLKEVEDKTKSTNQRRKIENMMSKLGTIRQSLEKNNLSKDDQEMIVNFFQEREKKEKWVNHFKKSCFAGFSELEKYLNTDNSERADFKKLSLALIDEIAALIVADQKIYQDMKVTGEVEALPTTHQAHLDKKLNEFMSSFEKRAAIFQLMSELYQALDNLKYDRLMLNKPLRNAMEHMHILFEVEDETIKNKRIFFETFTYICKIYEMVLKMPEQSSGQGSQLSVAAQRHTPRSEDVGPLSNPSKTDFSASLAVPSENDQHAAYELERQRKETVALGDVTKLSHKYIAENKDNPLLGKECIRRFGNPPIFPSF